MNKDGLIYKLSDEEQEAALASEPLNAAKAAELREDVARLDGYLRGRADSDRPKLGDGDGKARGPGSNKDLAG